MDVRGALIALGDLEVVGHDRYRSHEPYAAAGRVFGGQVAAEALVAAGRTVAEDRPVHALQCEFLRPGRPDQPIDYEVDRIRDGRSFTNRRVVARQGDEVIFHLAASFHTPEPGLEHQVPPPTDVPGPEGVPSVPDKLSEWGITDEAPWPMQLIDVRPLDAVDPGVPAPPAPGREVWVRAAAPLPDDPLLHAAVLTYASDLYLLNAALLPHGRGTPSAGIQFASLNHVVWFHRPVRVDEWLLQVQHVPSTGAARALATARFYSQQGTLVASVAQEGLIRQVRG